MGFLLREFSRQHYQATIVTFSNSTVEQDTPGEPDGAGEVKSVLFSAVSVGEPVAAEGGEPVQQVEDQSHHVYRHHYQDPQSVAERLQERDESGGPRGLPTNTHLDTTY